MKPFIAALLERDMVPEVKLMATGWFAFGTVFALDWALIDHLSAAFRLGASLLTFIGAAISTIWILRRAWRRSRRGEDTSSG
jgi:hypothetical protein